MGNAFRTPHGPYYKKRTSPMSTPLVSESSQSSTFSAPPPPSYNATIGSNNNTDIDTQLTDQVAATMRDILNKIRRDPSVDHQLELQTACTVNTGLVILQDPMVHPRLHEVVLVAEQALLRWESTGQRTVFSQCENRPHLVAYTDVE